MFNNTVQDIEALTQVIQSFGKHYKIHRTKIYGVNNRGRVDNAVVKDYVFAVIQPSNKRINTNNDGKGRWVTADSEIAVVQPEYFSMGDIIEVPGMGRMKVISVNDLRDLGAMTGALVRTGTTDPVNPLGNKRYEPN